MLRSVWTAGSTNLRAHSGIARRISRSRGTAPSSPSWMRTIRALSSFNAAARSSAGDSCRVFSGSSLSVATPQSPFSAIVLPVACSHKRCPGESLCGVAQCLYRCFQLLHAPHLLFPRHCCFFPPTAVLLIELGRRFRYRTGAEVLFDYTATAAHAPVVVAAPAPLLPGHATNRYESGASDNA
jgi:hypothetical protein